MKMMKIKQKLQTAFTVMALTVATSIGSLALVSSAHAEETSTCGGAKTSVIQCDEGDGTGDFKNSGVWFLLTLTLNILLAGVGVLALAGVVWGAILYTSAGGNTEQVKKAMGIFTNVAIGVVAFAGMWVLLNFLIPGGAFNNL